MISTLIKYPWVEGIQDWSNELPRPFLRRYGEQTKVQYHLDRWAILIMLNIWISLNLSFTNFKFPT